MCSARKEWKDAYRSRTVVGGVVPHPLRRGAEKLAAWFH